MNPEQFRNSQTGQLVPTIEEQWAYVPNPLPPIIDLAEVALPLADAMNAIGELRGACRRLQNPYMIIRPLQRREALTSSAMEGTFTTEDELALIEAGAEGVKDESAIEVYNYVKALNYSVDAIGEMPIAHRVIRGAHRILLSDLAANRGANKRPGEYKIHQNWIGGLTIDAARFVPPPPEQSSQSMDALEAYINRPEQGEIHPLIDLALIHYQFETIHPFADGNGRVGRMLITLLALQKGLLQMPVLYMSPFFEKHKDEYIDLMFGVSSNNLWSDWINFFCRAVSESCIESINTIDLLITLQEKYRERASEAGRSLNLITIVDMLFENPAISIPKAQEKINATYRSAQLSIEKLVDAKILIEIPDTYPKLFLAPEILRASRRLDQRPARVA